MKVLAVDTSAVVASCAIVENDRLLGEITVNNRLTHSQTLMVMIDQLLKNCECKLSDIDLFAAADGPGSYTGLRIGIATIKGLAHGMDKKVLGVNTLEALAFRLPHCEHLITPIMDARKNRVFTATYIWEDGKMRMLTEPCALTIEECLEDCGNYLDTVFTGDAVAIHRETIKKVLGENAWFAPVSSCFQSAAAVAQIAVQRADEAVNYAYLVPKYIGKSQIDKN